MTDFVSLPSIQWRQKRCEVLFTVWGCHTVLYEHQPWALRSRLSEAVWGSTAGFSTQCSLVDCWKKNRRAIWNLPKCLWPPRTKTRAHGPCFLVAATWRQLTAAVAYEMPCCGLKHCLDWVICQSFFFLNGTFSTKCHRDLSILKITDSDCEIESMWKMMLGPCKQRFLEAYACIKPFRPGVCWIRYYQAPRGSLKFFRSSRICH